MDLRAAGETLRDSFPSLQRVCRAHADPRLGCRSRFSRRKKVALVGRRRQPVLVPMPSPGGRTLSAMNFVGRVLTLPFLAVMILAVCFLPFSPIVMLVDPSAESALVLLVLLGMWPHADRLPARPQGRSRQAPSSNGAGSRAMAIMSRDALLIRRMAPVVVNLEGIAVG